MAKKKVITPSYMKRTGGSNHFFRLYTDLLKSPAFLDLSPKQKELYIACRAEEHGTAYRESVQRGEPDETLFFMNRALRVDVYRLYKESDTRCFERDMAALITHGFIDCVQSNYKSRAKNVYRYSSRWQAWNTAAFSLPSNVMTNHMMSKLTEQKGNK